MKWRSYEKNDSIWFLCPGAGQSPEQPCLYGGRRCASTPDRGRERCRHPLRHDWRVRYAAAWTVWYKNHPLWSAGQLGLRGRRGAAADYDGQPDHRRHPDGSRRPVHRCHAQRQLRQRVGGDRAHPGGLKCRLRHPDPTLGSGFASQRRAP